MRGSLANSMPAQNLANSLIGVTFETGVTVTGVTGVTLSKKQFWLDFDYSGIVPVYSGQFGASARDSFNRCNMKTITRKQAKEAIQSKGLEGAMHLGKSGLTAKQKKYAEGLVLEGLSGADSYRQAYKSKGKPKTVGNAASLLKQHSGIKLEMERLELHKQRAASYSVDSIKALIVSTLTDIATNSDRDAVRVSAVKTLGVISGVDMFRETKRIETVKDSDQIKDQIMQQLKTMMLSTDDAQEVDANDLLSELTAADPTHSPPPESVDGTPADSIHTIPLEPSQEFTNPTEDPPSSLDSSTPHGDIFSENPDGYQDATGRVSTLKVKS
jgi:hypothetical protein